MAKSTEIKDNKNNNNNLLSTNSFEKNKNALTNRVL